MIVLTFAPIKTWPTDWRPADAARPFTPFTASYSDTLDVVDRELHAIGARPESVRLQLDSAGGNFRRDGQVRADAVVSHPGVILSFDTSKHGTLTYPCDRFCSYGARGPAWHHNLRAIGLGLEALRKVERYGIAERGQQYAGFRELGTGIALGAGMTIESAARLLWDAAGATAPFELAAVRPAVEVLYRRAAKTHHPDAGGDPDMFRRITEARDLLVGS